MFETNNKLVHDGMSKNIKRILQSNQNMIDPRNPDPKTNRGYFFQSIGELEDHWQRFIDNKTLPSDKEIRSYFAVKNNYEMERGLMSLTEIRNKARNGVESFRIHNLINQTDKSATPNYSDRFDGRFLNSLPKDDGGIVINLNNRIWTRTSSQFTDKYRVDFERRLQEGKLKLIELWNPDLKSLNNWSDKIPKNARPQYVLTDKWDFQPLDFTKQVQRRGGGHLMPEYGYYLKFPDIYFDPISQKHVYAGDITALALRNADEGREIAMHLNKVHEHMIAGDEAGARSYMDKWGVAGLDFDTDIKARYQADTKAFNQYGKFYVVPKDATIPSIDADLESRFKLVDTDKMHLKDGTRHGNLSRTSTVAFNQPRDAYELHTIENTGTVLNPVWQHRPAKLIDPIDSLNRSMTRLSNSFYMDDYRNFAAEHWLQTFGKWLDIDEKDYRHSPLWAFYNADFRKDAPDNIKMLGDSNRKKARDFLGTPNSWDSMVNSVGIDLMNSISKKVRGKYLPFSEIPASKDPFQTIRGLVFDLKLGLGALPTFWTQFTALSNVAAISPRSAASAAMATLYHQWTRVNPLIVDELDKRASSGLHLAGMLGMRDFKPGQFKEAWDTLKETSFDQVGSEHAMLDSMLKDRGVRTFMDGLRYWGRIAFREGAQAVRTAAWYTAYLDFREANPTGALTRLDKSWILDRASMLDHNMSRASNSSINSGIMSVPAQFYTYARNLSEMFYGKRLTWQEKARLFGVNATLWGLPAGGIGLLGLPVGDYFRKQAEQGRVEVPGFTRAGVNTGWTYKPGEGPVSTGIMDGVLSLLAGYITGKGDIQAGKIYDFSKFGVKGWDPINNFLDTDKTFWDFMGGASFQTIRNTMYRSGNFMNEIGQLLHGEKFQPTWQDVADLFKESSGVSYSWKLYMALAHQVAMSNNNTPLENNVSTSDAIFRFITGLQPTQISDIGIHRGILTSREEFEKYINSQASRNFNLGLLAMKDGDRDAYVKYWTKGNTWLNSAMYPPDKKTDALNSFFTRKEDLVHSIDWSLSHSRVPESLQKTEQEREMVNQEMNRKRQESR
ncbi:MAG: hypothetical protein KGI25_08500 [Thaumarchaeota archaeon]|nr:hypothetical protein [Nitrososphaerota archaeon]